MPRIALVTDSTADLTPQLIEQAHLKVVPLVVNFDQDYYLDGVEMDTDRLFAQVEQRKSLPRTASPSPGAFQAAFEEATADGSEAIYIGLSSKLSSTMQNARIAVDMLPDRQIHVFDSGNLCNGIGLLVLYAWDLAREGKSAAEIMAALEAARSKVRSTFVIDTLDYLHMGGRCNSLTALVGSLLKLRPIIAVTDGGMTVAGKVRGARQKGLDAMLESFATDVKQGLVRADRVFVAQAGAPEELPYMVAQIRRIMPDVQQVVETQAGSVIGSHCGPGTVGLFYMHK